MMERPEQQEVANPADFIPGRDWDWDDEPGRPSKGSDGQIPEDVFR
jgi:hypothetical protein